MESLTRIVWPTEHPDPTLQPYVAKDLEHVVRITLPLHAKITLAVICEIADMLQAMAIRYRIDYAIEKASLDDILLSWSMIAAPWTWTMCLLITPTEGP